MPIEITGHNPAHTGTVREGGTLRAVPGGASQRPDNPTPPNATDTVSLTDAASLLNRVDAKIASLPATDVQRVAQMRQAIADGGFQPDPYRVAERLVQQEVALFGRR